jgi:hypothetical protein
MARNNLSYIFLLCAHLLLFIPNIFAQDAPLFIQGGFEDATATDESYNSGGTITVNGFNIQVPKNLQVQFPAAWVPWKDFSAGKESMLGYEINVLSLCSIYLGSPS